MILPRAWHLLRDVVDVLLEATPKGVDVQMIREHILAVDGVVSVHDIHIWTITSGVPVFSAHVVVEDAELGARGADRILDKLVSCLGSHFDTEHCTFQLEPATPFGARGPPARLTATGLPGSESMFRPREFHGRKGLPWRSERPPWAVPRHSDEELQVNKRRYIHVRDAAPTPTRQI